MDMVVSATELKKNLKKYLQLSATEDIFISKNGKIVFKLSNPYKDHVEATRALFGILPKEATLEEVREERCARLCREA